MGLSLYARQLGPGSLQSFLYPFPSFLPFSPSPPPPASTHSTIKVVLFRIQDGLTCLPTACPVFCEAVPTGGDVMYPRRRRQCSPCKAHEKAADREEHRGGNERPEAQHPLRLANKLFPAVSEAAFSAMKIE